MKSSRTTRTRKPNAVGKRKESVLVRIYETDKVFLDDLAREKAQSMPEVLSFIIERFKRQQFFDELAEAYADLKNNPKEWAEELDERRIYDGTLRDGLEED